MRLIVCGGRSYADRARVNAILDRVERERGIDAIIQGGADGADRWAAEWGWDHRKLVASYAADWDRHGRAAGPIRNQEMVDDAEADAVIAFPGGSGTADLVRRAQAAGLPVWDLRHGHSR